MEKLVLIDGNSLINRAFYAMPILSTKKGVFTNAVYGFMNMFTKMITEQSPSHIAVAFDLKHPTFRHQLFSDYKATRKPMPIELRPQIPLLKELLKQMGVCVLEKEGYEADDIIGTIAKATDVATIIITGDKDSFQLVDNQTQVHFTKRGLSDVEVYSNDNFLQKTGILPQQIIDLKALMGDASDNIPGVSGVGEKTALNLVQTYQSIENLYQNVLNLKGKLQEKIINGKDSAILSKTLATICLDAPVTTDLNDMTFNFPFPSSIKERFIELEFKSLISRQNLFSQKDNKTQQASYAMEQSLSTVKVESLSQLSTISLTDTLALAVLDDKVCIYDGKTEYQAKVNRTLLDDGFNLCDILLSLKHLFTSNATLIVFCKKDLRHLLKNTIGEVLSCFVEDLSLIKYLADFGGGEETLEQVILQYSKEISTPAFAIYQIYYQLLDKLKEEGMVDLYYNVELPLSDVLYDMENDGFKVDITALSKTGETFKVKLNQLEQLIKKCANDDSLNVNSPKQLGDVLFEKLKIGKGKKTKTGYSTNAEILESLEDAHPIVPLILEYRKLAKLHSTYIEGFKNVIDKSTGLIHTSFNQTVTATGRLSSKEPNLQNIPIREELGRELRKFFVPRNENGILIGADYSQIELRLLAAFSKCQPLINAFANGIDVHSVTASKVFKVDIDNVTPSMRSSAKAVNFGIIYGISEYGLAKNIKTSASEARNYINSYFEEYPQVKKYMQANVDFAKENGYATTILGRRRYISELSSPNYNLRSFGERVAMNMPLQGSSADIIKLAMLGVSKRLKQQNLKSKLILQVHDELIIDAVIEEEQIVKQILVEEMKGAVKLSVELDCNVGSGKTWFEAK